MFACFFYLYLSELCKALYAMKRKTPKFTWREECQKSFELLKIASRYTPPLPFLTIQIIHRSLKITLMLVLLGLVQSLYSNMLCIAYSSKNFNIAERNYSNTARDCPAVVWAFNKSRCYFNELSVKLIIDHST